MTNAELFDLVDREGLLGLYHCGLFSPITCEYEGTALQLYWEHAGLPHLMSFRTKRSKR